LTIIIIYKKKTHPTVEIAPSSPPYPKKEIALFKKEKKPQILFPLPKAPFITYIALFFQLIFITYPLYPFNPHILKQTPFGEGKNSNTQPLPSPLTTFPTLERRKSTHEHVTLHSLNLLLILCTLHPLKRSSLSQYINALLVYA